MRVSQEFINQLELLYEAYEQEIGEKLRAGILKDTTAKTYLTHSSNFVRWRKNDFISGERNQ
jgi:hypothetical protein